jgi:nucleotidyltransferase/DNA polymerase involved in DNA repair
MCSVMVVATLIPRFPLLIALRRAGRPPDAAVALGPQPGEPAVVGMCTPAAEMQGVRAGLRVGEALARCPGLELVTPDPDAAARAAEEIVGRLEGLGAGVEPLEPGLACFASDGLERLHGGFDGVLRRVRGVLPVGAGGLVGAAPSRFAAVQAARAASPRSPLVVPQDEVASFLAPLPADRLPLDAHALAALDALGLVTMGQVAELPRGAALDRLGFPGLGAWRLARGEADSPVRARRPPDPLEAAFTFPEAVGSRQALEAAARLLLAQLAAAAHGRGRAIRALTLRARLEEGASWTSSLTLREATADPERLAAAALPRLADVAAPVETLTVRADASGSLGGHQLTVVAAADEERARRVREASRQVRSALGDDALLRPVEIEPGSRLPERRWALVPFEP